MLCLRFSKCKNEVLYKEIALPELMITINYNKLILQFAWFVSVAVSSGSTSGPGGHAPSKYCLAPPPPQYFVAPPKNNYSVANDNILHKYRYYSS